MTLSDREKAELKALIDADQPLPARYRNLLFADAPEVELIWQGKTREVTNVVLPFQVIEQIDEPRSEGTGEALDLFARDPSTGRQESGWTNKLIWGDNKLVLSALKNGPLRKEIEAAGGIKLIYIDPPFDVGADFSFDLEVGEETLTRAPTAIEEIAYRDTWGKGTDGYLAMIYQRLTLAKDLLSESGVIVVHVDWRMVHLIRLVLDQLMGSDAFLNQIAWVYGSSARGAKAIASHFARNHDNLLAYSKGSSWAFNGDIAEREFSEQEALRSGFRIDQEGRWFKTSPRGDYTDESVERLSKEGRIYLTNSGTVRIKYFLETKNGKVVERAPVGDAWMDIPDAMHLPKVEKFGYPTQKPESLLARVVTAYSNHGDLVLDFFCGSGTTMAVAEKLGRKWIGCDLGRFAIHTSRKRLIGVQRELKKEGKPYRSFEILNLGKYERQWFIGVDPTLPDDQRQAQSRQREEAYLDLICQAYRVTRVTQHPVFHGRRGHTMVVVGPVDAPVTEALIHQALDACAQEQITACDVLGFDWEMGLTPRIQEEAGRKGVALALKYIPRDVFDRRAVDKGEVQFYDVAYVEASVELKQRTVSVSLTDFGVHYRQDDLGRLTDRLRPGQSKVVVDAGAVQKLTKQKDGTLTAEVLTREWSDWIDYWAVDFDHENRQELIRALDDNGNERQYWTGNFIFENEWQSYRTRKIRALELTSATHEYPPGTRGKKKIAVKVIDIFGNDTTRVFEVHIK